MAVLKGNVLRCKKSIKEVLKKINEGKYKIDYILIDIGTEETKPIKDKDGKLWSTSKRNFHDTFTISYIDKEAKENIK